MALIECYECEKEISDQAAACPHCGAPKEEQPPQVSELLKVADQGDASAQSALGYMYREGLGVPEDHAEAVRLYRLAAEQGLAEAQFNLGAMYDYGIGVPQDDVEAVRWWRLAAEQGLAEAQFNLGNLYARGLGVPEDHAEAVRLYRLAAEQGLAEAQHNLGDKYRNGEGVPQDDVEAVRWWRLAAAQGDALAQYNLGVMYAGGEGVPQDDVEAVRLYRLAAEQGYANAQYYLGFMYANGDGVPEDLVLAYMWCQRDVDYVEFVGFDRLVCGPCDCSCSRYSDDHGYVRLGQCDCDDDGESGRVFGNALSDEPVVHFGRGDRNTHSDREGCRRDHDLGCQRDVDYVEFVGCDRLVCGPCDCSCSRTRHHYRDGRHLVCQCTSDRPTT